MSPSTSLGSATKLVPHYAAMGEERRKAALLKGNKTRHEKESPVVARRPQPARGTLARDEAAKAVGVGGRTVNKAQAVRNHGSDELIKAVARVANVDMSGNESRKENGS